MKTKLPKTVKVLLIEDSEADTDLIIEALKAERLTVHLDVVQDVEQGLDFLKRQGRYQNAGRPDLILLDLNLPKKNGRELLRNVKSDPNLCLIPVLVLTSSAAEEDIIKSYRLHANAYIIKPIDYESYKKILNQITEFWFSLVALPPPRCD